MIKSISLRVPANQLLLSVAIASALTGCGSLGGIAGGGAMLDSSEFQKGVYASAGIGASRLTPNVDNFPSLDVNDRVEPAGQVTVGIDLSPTFSVEAHSADLGSAGFSPSGGADGSSSAGRYNYHMSGISALAYFGKNKHNAGRKGMTTYGRLGLAAIKNSAVNNTLVYEREDEAPVLVGAGVEYATSKGIGLRAEGMTNGSDTSYAQVGLLYRLGIRSKKKPKLAQAPAAPAKKMQPVVAIKKPTIAAVPVIAAAKVPVDQGVSMMDMVLFDTDSADLTQSARSTLLNVAQRMKASPTAVLNLEGHADATGDAEYNMALSNRRASRVADFLVRQGVGRSQLTDINAYGESSPSQNNSTSEGRAANRRVELFGESFAR